MSSLVNNGILDDIKSVDSDRTITTETDSQAHRSRFLSRFFHSTIDLNDKCENDVLDTDRILGGNLRNEKRKRGTKGIPKDSQNL